MFVQAAMFVRLLWLHMFVSAAKFVRLLLFVQGCKCL